MSTYNISTTKMSSKGQVVIPEEIREYLDLESGSQFIVMAAEDSIVLKKIKPIPKRELLSLLKKSKQFAKDNDIKPSDVEDAIKAVRARKKKLTTKDKASR